jgi:hypothetical protein
MKPSTIFKDQKIKSFKLFPTISHINNGFWELCLSNQTFLLMNHWHFRNAVFQTDLPFKALKFGNENEKMLPGNDILIAKRLIAHHHPCFRHKVE